MPEIQKNQASVWAQVQGIPTDLNNNISCLGIGSVVTFGPGIDGGAAGKRRYVLFRTDQSMAMLQRFLGEIRHAGVSCGFKLRDALLYERVIIMGIRGDYSNDELDLIDDAAQGGYEIHFIDPTDPAAEQNLIQRLN